MSQDSWRMPRLDGAWLDSLGYGALNEPQKRQVLRAAFSALELKVGAAVSRSLPNELIAQYELIINHPQQEVADAQGIRFLQDNVPGYRDIVRATFQQLADELRLIRVEFDDLRKSRGRPSGMEDRSGQISPSPRPEISDMAHMESSDDASGGVNPPGSQEKGGSDR